MSNTQFGPAAGIPMTPQWQEWVAENVLRGAEGETILRAMLDSGFDEPTARGEIETALQHPYLRAAAANTGSGGGTRAQKYAWFLEVGRRMAKQSPDWGTVPRVPMPPMPEFLERYYATNRPVVIEGAMAGWPALTKWTGEHLREQYGDQTVEVEVYRVPNGGRDGNSDDRVREQMIFRDFVDIVEDGTQVNGHYMTANNTEVNAAAFAGLWDDVGQLEFLAQGEHPLGKGFLWYGPEGSLTPMHHDLTNNLMAQFRGRKRVKLIAPSESAHVYNDNHRYSKVDMDAVDLERFPEMADVTIWETEIGPGDMLFVPAGWWHSVRALDVSITITFANFAWETDLYSMYTTHGAID